MGSVYSLRLLQHEVAREWLLAREEPKLPPSFMDSSLALRHRVFLGSKPKFVDQLFKPVGVVNGVLIGYSLANYHLVLPADWVPTVEPVCRRFALDLSNNEFLELHWFQNNTVMTSWLKFANSNHRIRYFVLYEAPPHGKLPSKLLKSVELVLQRVDDQKPESEEDSYMLAQLADPRVHLLSLAQERLLSIIPKSRAKAKRHLGIFYGTARKTVYKDMSVVDDCFLPYRQCTHVLRETNEESLNADETDSDSPNHVQKNIKLPLINIHDGAMMIKEFLSMERQHCDDKSVQKESGNMNSFERRQRRRYILSVKRAHKERNANCGNMKTEGTVFQAAELLSSQLFSHSTRTTAGNVADFEVRERHTMTETKLGEMEHLQVGLYECGVTYSLPSSERSSEYDVSHGVVNQSTESDASLQWIDFDPIEKTSDVEDNFVRNNKNERKLSESVTKRMQEEPFELNPQNYCLGTKRKLKDMQYLSSSSWDDFDERSNDDFLNTLNHYLFAMENEDGDYFRVTDTKEDELQNFLERSFV